MQSAQRPILAVVTDNAFNASCRGGELLAAHMRQGKYGHNISHIPIAIVTGGPQPANLYEIKPPIVLLGKKLTEEPTLKKKFEEALEQLIGRKTVVAAYNKAQIVDYNAQMLTEAILPAGRELAKDGWGMRIKSLVNYLMGKGKKFSSIDAKQTYAQWFESLSVAERDGVMSAGLEYTKECIANTFLYHEGLWEWPSRERMREIKKAMTMLDQERPYIPRDDDHNRFSLLIGEVKSKLREYEGMAR